MKVYHGTNATSVDSILQQGLKPRQATGKSNWDHNDMESLQGHVYLTDKYAPYFGIVAADNSEFALVEVDLDRLNSDSIFPDEDFIEQAIRHDMDIEYPNWLNMDGDMIARTEEVREHIRLFQPYWEVALDVMGNISYHGTIPPEAISRVSVADPPSGLRLAIDPQISIRAAQLTGGKYEMLTRLLMGDDVSRDEYLTHSLGTPIPDDASISDALSEEDGDELASARNGEVGTQLEQDYVSCSENPTYNS